MINFAHSRFNRIIIHRIFAKKRDEEHSSVEHENQLIVADDEVRRIIKERVNEACGKQSKSFKLQIAKVNEGAFFHLAKDTHSLSESDFITRSKKIATLLGVAQKRTIIPGGFLIIIEGVTDEQNNFMLVIKAELQEAFTTKFDQETNKKQIEVLREIFLSPAEKFFKIGIICQSENPEENFPNNEFSCMIHDDQFRPGGIPAEFFYSDFLGFSLDKNEKILTKGFYQDTKSVIMNSNVENDTKKSCLNALRTIYKQDQTGIIDPTEFGERFLPPEVREPYAANVLAQPKYNRPFTKDLSIMGRELTNRIMHFRNKITVQGPEELFDESIKVVKSVEEAVESLQNPNNTLLEIKGTPYNHE